MKLLFENWRKDIKEKLIQESHFPLTSGEKLRIHHSRQGSRIGEEPQVSGFSQKAGRKPNGLWYECQDGSSMDWQTFCDTGLSTKYSERYDSTYNVDLEDYNILFIPDIYYFDKFTEMYGVPHPAFPNDPEEKLIDWAKVAEHYSGIEICPYIADRRDVEWYYGWDVASGCVWDQEGIKELREVKC